MEKQIRCGEIDEKRNRRCGKLLFEMTKKGVEVKCRGCGKWVTFQYVQFLEAIMSAISEGAPQPRVEKVVHIVSRLLDEG